MSTPLTEAQSRADRLKADLDAAICQGSYVRIRMAAMQYADARELLGIARMNDVAPNPRVNEALRAPVEPEVTGPYVPTWEQRPDWRTR